MKEFIYIFRTFGENNTSLLKLGYSSDKWSRVKSHQDSNPYLKLLYKAELENAFKIEQDFHKQNKSTVGNEFYEEVFYSLMIDYLNQFEHIDCTDENKPIIKRVYNPKYEKIGETFKELLCEYCNIVDGKISNLTEDYILSIIPEAYDIVKKLGTDKCRALGYIKKSINQLLYNGTQEVNNAIKIELKAKYNSNVAYSSNDVKAFLQELYDKLKLNKKAKATDLAEYLQIDKKKRLLNGKVQDSIVITSEIILNSKATEMYNLLDIPEKPVDNVLDYLDLD